MSHFSHRIVHKYHLSKKKKLISVTYFLINSFFIIKCYIHNINKIKKKYELEDIPINFKKLLQSLH